MINAKEKRQHVKHYLTSLRDMELALKGKQDRMTQLRELATGLRSVMGESVAGGIKRELADTMHEIRILEDEYAADLEWYASEVTEGYCLCPVTNIPRYVCWLHWAEGKTWEEAGMCVGYSGEHCRGYLCNQGVEEIYGVMPPRRREDFFEGET